MPVNVMLYGHSFVSRLYQFLTTRGATFDLPSNYHIHLAGFPGLTLDKAKLNTQPIVQFNPDILILELGTNDLSHPDSIPPQLAQDILSFAVSLFDICDVQLIIINQIYFRQTEVARFTRSDFNQCASEYHDTLATLASHNPKVLCHFHKNLQTNWHQFLNPDGVHLSPSYPLKSAMFRYLLSIRDAIIKGAKLLA